jgi:Zn-dependent peptidase ImmA (M78 family)
MTFIPEARIENRASELWRRHALEPNFDLEVLLDQLKLGLLWDRLPTNVLGALHAQEHLVILNQDRLPEFQAMPGLERFTIGHEVGHAMLHADDSWTGTLPMLDAGKTWCRDGSLDPTEFQANRFASYLLIPSDRLISRLPTSTWSGWSPVYRLAETFGVTPTAMIVRLEHGRLAHRDDAGAPVSGPSPRDPAGQESLPGI